MQLCIADSRDDNALTGQTVEKATDDVRKFLADAGEEDTLDVYLILKDVDEDQVMKEFNLQKILVWPFIDS